MTKTMGQQASMLTSLLVHFTMIWGVLLLVIMPQVVSLGGQCGWLHNKWLMTENSVLKNFVYERKTVSSRVICGRDCSMDKHCKSFNFRKCSKVCEFNQATRAEHFEDFSENQGSAYFDMSEDTYPLFSLNDSTLDNRMYNSCRMLQDAGNCSSGVYTIYPDGFTDGLKVYCNMETDGGGWIVFQRRQDGSVDFDRDWGEYRTGFGNLSGEFWLGNDKLVSLTSDTSRGKWDLYIDLKDWDNNTAWSKYRDFEVVGQNYTLYISYWPDAHGTIDYPYFEINREKPFSTRDRDNDGGSTHCAQKFTGGWWHSVGCTWCNLNGKYYSDRNSASFSGNGNHSMFWLQWNLDYPDDNFNKCSMKMCETGW